VATGARRYAGRTMSSSFAFSWLKARGTAALAGVFAAAAVALLSAAGCSSDNNNNNNSPVACDSAKCAEGNKCLPLGAETKCRKVCSSNSDPAKACPFGYTCVDQQTGVEPFCVQDTAKRADGQPLAKKPNGQWGAACNAAGGLDANPDCDSEQQFYCFGLSNSDGNAYCTRYGCEKDSDCGAGFTCQDVNVAPNVTTTKRTVGETQKICVRRTYCSACKVDLDCPDKNGKKQHCAAAETDGAGYCTPECDASQNCNDEAFCADPGIGVKVCIPRARTCVGDGSLCSPCRNDKDCKEGGICEKGKYTTEYSCMKKAPSSCQAGKAKGGCVGSLTTPKVNVGCYGGANSAPEDYCHGIFDVGGFPDVGCWSRPR
jgi:hypothetical protein